MRYPYELLYKLLSLTLGRNNSEVWLRNSLALDYWQFGLSDIDLSIYCSTNKYALEAIQTLKSVRLLLLGGEVQIYTSEQLEIFFDYANPIELRRDPHLLSKQKITKKPDELDEVVFLLKMLLSDHSLDTIPGLREPKWRTNFKLIEKPLKKFSKHKILIAIHRYPVIGDNISFSDFESFFLRPQIDHMLAPLFLSNKIAWHTDEARSMLDEVSELNPKLHQLLNRWQQWEIWGLSVFTPLTHRFSKESFFSHLISQNTLNHALNLPLAERDKVDSGFRALRSFYDDFDF